jgi:hypothetical protein
VRAGRLLCVAAMAATSCLPGSAAAVSSTHACRPTIRHVAHLQERIDSLLAVHPAHAVVALAGHPMLGGRFLPHDHLLLLTPAGRVRARIGLPRYTTPPGMAATADARTVYLVVDGRLFRLDPVAARLRGSRQLDMQALGWPGAAATGTGGRLYLVGQPHRASLPFAVVEAITVGRSGTLHVLWRRPLGTTHAGIWLGLAARGRLAAYVPNPSDVAGTVVLLDERTGSLRSSYPVPAPPLALDPSRNRLYLDDAGTIHALSLTDGRPVAVAPGSGPVAVDASHGTVAFRRRGAVVLATARALRPLAIIPLSGPTSLGYDVEGSTLLAGLQEGLAQIDVKGCSAS